MKTPSKEVPLPRAASKQFKFENGWEVQDSVTGFTGYIIYRVDNITGCDNYGVQPKGTSSEMPDVKLIDANRLTFTGKIKGLPTPLPQASERPGGIKSIPTRKIK